MKRAAALLVFLVMFVVACEKADTFVAVPMRVAPSSIESGEAPVSHIPVVGGVPCAGPGIVGVAYPACPTPVPTPFPCSQPGPGVGLPPCPTPTSVPGPGIG
jgi:hypothetical protein